MTTGPNDPGRPAPPAQPGPRGGAPTAGPRGDALMPTLRPGPRRADDRRVVVAALVIAGGFLAAAALAVVAGPGRGTAASPWLPLHLALAGGATTAIAGVMPFFVAALAAGHPADARLRAGAVALVAAGAALVAVRGLVPAWSVLPPVGGSVFLAGIGLLALALNQAGTAGLMVRRPVVTLAYQLAVVNVTIGAILGTLAVAGWLPVLERWALLRPAHAWTNLLGFVSLTVAGTLLHFLPTVFGTRIVPRASALIAVLALAAASPAVVLGLALGSGPIAGGGAVLSMVGAAALALETARVTRARGRWTTDPGWHRLSGIGLVAGVAWFVIGVTLASARVLALGAVPDAWSTALVGAPLALGWVVQVLIASWTHLLPAIGPGGPVGHAARRVVLGRASTARLVALNAGTALLAIGWPAGIGALAVLGGALAAAGVLASVALAAAALRIRA